MLRELSTRLQLAREGERTRIARQVHDESGRRGHGHQVGAGPGPASSGDGNVAGALTSADEASRMADDLMNQLRHIATELRPALLDELGLVAAVEWQLQDFQKRTGIETRLVTTGKTEYPPAMATVLFRVLQELLTNVARHAQAQRVKVRISRPHGNIALAVRDNGRGISEADTHRSGSLGLLGIQERVQQLGGTFSIQGAHPKGTVARVTLPLARNA